LQSRAASHFKETGRLLFSDYLQCERREGKRTIGATAPGSGCGVCAGGFFRNLGHPAGSDVAIQVTAGGWRELAAGVLNASGIIAA